MLALYDNGVLIFSILMLNLPSITDYQQQQQLQLQQHSKQLIMFHSMGDEFFNHNHQLNKNRGSSPSSSLLMMFPYDLPYDVDDDANLDQYPNLINKPILSSTSTTTATTTSISDFIFPPTSSFSPSISLSNKIETTSTLDTSQIQDYNLLNFHSIRVRHHRRQSHDLDQTILTSSSTTPTSTRPFQSLSSSFSSSSSSTFLTNFLPDQLYIAEHLSQSLASTSTTIETTNTHNDNDEDHDDGGGYENSEYSQQSQSSPLSGNMYPLIYYVKIVYPMALISQTGSIWTTCLITIERYLAVCHPLMSLTLSTRSRAIWALSILSAAALLFNLPRFAEVDTSGSVIRPTELRKNKIYYYVYYICLNLSLNYILPLSLLSALNTRIYASVRHANAHRNELTRARQSELHLASMLVLIVAIFIGRFI